ncbi:MAG: pirin family protein [Vulcanimicrobiaceae bacterium]
MTSTTAIFEIQRASERGHADHGWLQTSHSFSFADYFDPERMQWGALRVFNDDVVAPGQGFGRHPHRDMEILTYVLDGELEHKDSMGNVGVVGAGAVQYLSAGSGIAHSEYNHSAARPVHLVQMWVVPHAAGLTPRYGQVDYTRADRLDRWLPIATGEPGIDARIAIWQDATAYVARVEAATLTKTLRAGRKAFLFVCSGDVTVNGATLQAGDAVRVAGALDLVVSGTGELVLWDVPPAGDR